jgi:gamma-glutamyl phosphate reductase
MTKAAQNLQEQALDLGRRAKAAARQLAQLSTVEKNRALLAMAQQLEAKTTFLTDENR